jgi:hypothetical protein
MFSRRTLPNLKIIVKDFTMDLRHKDGSMPAKLSFVLKYVWIQMVNRGKCPRANPESKLAGKETIDIAKCFG